MKFMDIKTDNTKQQTKSDVTFITKSGSTYFVDQTNQTIKGGKYLQEPTHYVNSPSFMQGGSALFELDNGDKIRTNIIEKAYTTPHVENSLQNDEITLD